MRSKSLISEGLALQRYRPTFVLVPIRSGIFRNLAKTEQSVGVFFLHADSLSIRDVAGIQAIRRRPLLVVLVSPQPRTYATTSGATIDAKDRTPIHARGQARPREHRDIHDAGMHFRDLT